MLTFATHNNQNIQKDRPGDKFTGDMSKMRSGDVGRSVGDMIAKLIGLRRVGISIGVEGL